MGILCLCPLQTLSSHSPTLCTPGDDSLTGLGLGGALPGLGRRGCLAQLCLPGLLLGPLSLLLGPALGSQLCFALAPRGFLAVIGAISRGRGGRGLSSCCGGGRVCAQSRREMQPSARGSPRQREPSVPWEGLHALSLALRQRGCPRARGPGLGHGAGVHPGGPAGRQSRLRALPARDTRGSGPALPRSGLCRDGGAHPAAAPARGAHPAPQARPTALSRSSSSSSAASSPSAAAASPPGRAPGPVSTHHQAAPNPVPSPGLTPDPAPLTCCPAGTGAAPSGFLPRMMGA